MERLEVIAKLSCGGNLQLSLSILFLTPIFTETTTGNLKVPFLMNADEGERNFRWSDKIFSPKNPSSSVLWFIYLCHFWYVILKSQEGKGHLHRHIISLSQVELPTLAKENWSQLFSWGHRWQPREQDDPQELAAWVWSLSVCKLGY